MIRISYRGMNIRLITNVLGPIWCLIIHRHCIFENDLDCVVINLKDGDSCSTLTSQFDVTIDSEN